MQEVAENTCVWYQNPGLIDYPTAVHAMEAYLPKLKAGAPHIVWLLEHPPVYTAGTSAQKEEFLGHPDIPLFQTGRGGKMTYHGPGQRVVYVLFDLKRLGLTDVKHFVWLLEEWMIQTLKKVDVKAERRNGRIGLWVTHDGQDEKIAALGIRIRQGCSYHGMALNVSPNLEHFKGIVPCGLGEYDVTSLEKLGHTISLEQMDALLKERLRDIFPLHLFHEETHPFVPRRDSSI